MKFIRCLVGFGVAMAAVQKAEAANLGDPAPGIAIERWIKGTPVRVGPGKNIYVVEFWATWCPPCKESIPRLTAWQKQYANRGVIFLGISDEPVSTVTPFVTAQGANMDYRVAVDSSGRTYNLWKTAFEQSGIPHAYIVGTNGTVLWHGFPSAGLGQALDRILAGTYDLDRERNFDLGDRYVARYTAMVTRPNTAPRALQLGELILTHYSRDWRVPHRLAQAILTDSTVQSRDYALALRATTRATEITGDRSSDASAMHARALYANGKRTEAVAWQKKAVAACEDPQERAELEKLLTGYQRGASAGAGGGR